MNSFELFILRWLAKREQAHDRFQFRLGLLSPCHRLLAEISASFVLAALIFNIDSHISNDIHISINIANCVSMLVD